MLVVDVETFDASWRHLSRDQSIVHYSPVNSIQLLTGFEGNRWSVGPEDELLPEAEGRGQQFIWGANRSSVARKPRQQLFCYTPFSWIMFNDERTVSDKMIHYTSQNVIHFFYFLPLMNYSSRQNTNAIAYKFHWYFLLQATQPVLSAKVSQNDAYFRQAHGRFFRRSSIASRHSFSIFYAVLTIFFVFWLSLPSRIIFISSSEALATLWSASATTDAICKRSNVKRR